MRVVLAALLLAMACGVRAPTPIDVAALVAKRGAVEARRDLTMRVLDDPRDVQARLALAALAEQTGRPSEAIEQLEAVERLGGPIGTRWHDDDRARLGRLLLARGRARLARGAATAIGDLERAKAYGAVATADEVAQARVARAIAQLRHVDVKERAKGRVELASRVAASDVTATTMNATAAATTTKPAMPTTEAGGTSTATETAATTAAEPDITNPVSMISSTTNAAWRGARPNATPAERGAFGAWLWSVGARREAYDQLAAWREATKRPRDEQLQGAYLRALAWWSPVWLGEVQPPPAEELVGPERCWFPGTDCMPPTANESPSPAATAPPEGDVRAAAATRYAATRFVRFGRTSRAPNDVAALDSVTALDSIVRAFARDPAIAERLGRDYVASATDAALGHATVGALFDALGDPARARTAWHAAVAASAEPQFVRGLAEAAARTGDGPAALVFATQAAAAWGDPAVVWTSVAGALVDAGKFVDGLTAARNAIDLAGPEVLARALDIAADASRALRRPQQADAILAQRAKLDSRIRPGDAEAHAALLAHRASPTASTIARMWVASRAAPREVELLSALAVALDADDPRRDSVIAELFALVADPDSERALAAAAALRR